MQGNCHDPSTTIETFNKSRWLYSYSHFHLSSNIKFFQSRSCQTGSWCKFQKKTDSDEEEKEEEREEEEEEVAAALDNNDVSNEQVDTYACDHSKQGLETQIASETHKDPVSEVADGCESAKKIFYDIEKDVTDPTGQKEVMGGSVQVENQFSHDNINENANDQSKHQLDPKIGTKNTKGPESECKDGGDTYINVVGTDVISPQEGASDDKSVEPPVLPSNPPSSGKLLAYQQFLE
jgi:hypothetical protein